MSISKHVRFILKLAVDLLCFDHIILILYNRKVCFSIRYLSGLIVYNNNCIVRYENPR